MTRLFYHYLQGMLDIIFPRNCLLCRNYHPRTHRDPLCPSCQSQLPWNKQPVSLQLPEQPFFDHIISILHYSQTAQVLLKQFKFHNKSSLKKTWNSIFIEYFKHHPLPVNPSTVIVPIPLHPARLRERGFNQSSLIAQSLKAILKLSLREDILMRERPTRQQSTLHQKERWTNMRSAFRIHPLANIVGKNIILVDDILTTGATVNEAAKTLKEAGALNVMIITLANVSCASCTTTS